tara:strand:- start:455 stop:1630 length:1176 start_codon:yes stop_codon:yes gene_type:complete
MGFKLPGKSIHTGTNAHSSALKMQQEQNAAAKLREEQLKKAQETHMNLDPYADGGTTEPGDSPAKNIILKTIVKGGAKLYKTIKKSKTKPKKSKSLTTTSKSTKTKTTAITKKQKDQGPNWRYFEKSKKGSKIDDIKFNIDLPGAKPNILKRALKNPWITIPSGIGIGTIYGWGEGEKSERERLKKLAGEYKTGEKKKKPPKTISAKRTTLSDTRKYTQAKSRNPKLDALITQRRGFKKGTPEYNAIQNQINIAYGDPTRHGQTKSISTKRRKTTRVTDTPGVSTKVVTGKKRISGKLKKRVTDIDRVEGMGRDRKIVEKFRKSGARKKTVEKYDAGQAIAGGQLGKKKVKTKYTRSGDVKKTITVEGGKRIVRDAQGNIIKSKKTINPFD